VKFLEWGTQKNHHAVKVSTPWLPEDTVRTITPTVELRPVIEKYLRIYLPWKRKRYCVNVDDEVAMQPCWHVYWHPASPATRGCYVGRWGWQ
jgi:hypothetical protein